MMAIFYALGLLDRIQIAAVGLAPSQYQVYLTDLKHAVWEIGAAGHPGDQCGRSKYRSHRPSA
jgi:hypothetical protein